MKTKIIRFTKRSGLLCSPYWAIYWPGGFKTMPFISWPSAIMRRLRALFPQCYAVGAHDCDTGGLVYRWYPVFTWNQWHADRLARKDIGDGPDTWHPITFREFFRLKRGGES